MSPTGDLHVTMIFDREDVALGLPEHSYVLPQHGTLLGAAHPLGGQYRGLSLAIVCNLCGHLFAHWLLYI